jgi:hypothetical protein
MVEQGSVGLGDSQELLFRNADWILGIKEFKDHGGPNFILIFGDCLADLHKRNLFISAL